MRWERAMQFEFKFNAKITSERDTLNATLHTLSPLFFSLLSSVASLPMYCNAHAQPHAPQSHSRFSLTRSSSSTSLDKHNPIWRQRHKNLIQFW
mmetsp:Transcript_27327/g.76664  ORF Transcript_27327/g.76664 Transcript_27327/m.76664 type:complete len:94 (-) Transcript_27327:194-475(-)